MKHACGSTCGGQKAALARCTACAATRHPAPMGQHRQPAAQQQRHKHARQLPQSGAHGVSLRMRAAVLQLEHVHARRLRGGLRAGGGVQRAAGRPAGSQQPHAVAGQRQRARECRAPAPRDRRRRAQWHSGLGCGNSPAQSGQAMDATSQSRAWHIAVLPEKCSRTHVHVITDMQQDAAQWHECNKKSKIE